MAHIFSEMRLACNQNAEWTWYYIVVKKIGMFFDRKSNVVFTALVWGWVNGGVEWNTVWAALSQQWKINSSVLS